MTAFMLSFLLLFTIVAAFVFGIAMGYWAICGVLHLFHPARTQRSQGGSAGADQRGLRLQRATSN